MRLSDLPKWERPAPLPAKKTKSRSKRKSSTEDFLSLLERVKKEVFGEGDSNEPGSR